MKKYVQIQSSINIAVTSGLQGRDFTKTDSDLPNRLKISADWPKTTIMITVGQHWYPSQIAEWNTVKSLVASGVMTIGIDSDEQNDSVNGDEFGQTLQGIMPATEEPRQKRPYHRRSLEEVADNE